MSIDNYLKNDGKKYFCDERDLLYVNYENDLGDPGQYPYTRGIYRTMYGEKLWTMREYSGYGDAAETNRRYKYLLGKGMTGLSVAFDLPTQLGMDSDDPMARGEVGKVGVAIDSLKDMEELFEGISLEKVSTSMTINSPTIILLAMYVALAKKRGNDMKKLRGTVQNDILKEYVARGTYIFGIDASLRLVTDVFEYVYDYLPEWNTISVSGYHLREAGATAAEEVGITIANAMEYLERSKAAGIRVDRVAPRFSFFFAAHNNFFEEIAKFRAARRIWARIMKQRYEANNPRSMMMRFHVQTAGSTLTAEEPQNNIVRVALQSLAAVLGGAQSLHSNSMDEAMALPSEESVRTAVRTQQIIAYETDVPSSGDPLGGSYFVESQTNSMEYEIVRVIEKIDRAGGAAKAIESGLIADMLEKSAYEYQVAVEKGDVKVVGVNSFREGGEGIDPVSDPMGDSQLKVDESVESDQLERLGRLRAERDGAAVEEALRNLRKACESTDNLVGPVMRAVEAYATIGEITDVMKSVFGVYENAR